LNLLAPPDSDFASLSDRDARRAKNLLRLRSRDVATPGTKKNQKFFWFLRPDNGAAKPRNLNRAAINGSKKAAFA
jgi:hypothetical protein